MPYPKKSDEEKRATKAAQMRRYREKHPDTAKRPPAQAKKANATYRATHKAQLAAGKKRYNQAHKEEVNAYNRFRRKHRTPGRVDYGPKEFRHRWAGLRRKIAADVGEQRTIHRNYLETLERDARAVFEDAQHNFQQLARTMAPRRRESAAAGVRSLYVAWQQAKRRLRDAMK